MKTEERGENMEWQEEFDFEDLKQEEDSKKENKL